MKSQGIKKVKRTMPPAVGIGFRVHPDLKRLLWQKADEEGMPLNELVAKLLAHSLGRPELAKIPRKQLGRPRKEIPATE
jgi:hypothetical protein